MHVVVPCQFSGRKDGVQFHPIRPTKSRLYRMIFLPWFVMWKTLKTKSSIYHFHDPELLIVGFAMRWVLSKKVVFDMRESTSQQIMGKEYLPRWCRPIISFCYRLIERVCLKGVAVIVANDKSVEGNEPCFLVRNFPELDEELMAGVMDMNERMKSPLLVYVGGVWEGRGAYEYIELAKQLLERGHKIHMMII